MASSGTYTFNPSLGELTLYAYNLIGIRNTSLAQEHMEAARMASNMMLARWSNQGVNLWAVDLVSVALVQGQSVYPVDGSTMMVLDAYVGITSGGGPEIDRIIMPVSRTEYASYPNKEQQGFTTVYWFDRLISSDRSTGSAGPSLTLWPVPDGTSAQVLKYYRVRQLQDSEFVLLRLRNSKLRTLLSRWAMRTQRLRVLRLRRLISLSLRRSTLTRMYLIRLMHRASLVELH